MQQDGVPTAIYYPIAMCDQPPYKSYPVAGGHLAVTADLCERVIALPMHPYLDEATQSKVAAALKAAL